MSKKLICCITALFFLSVCLPILAETAGQVPELLPAGWTPVSGDCGAEVSWTLDSDGILTISGDGEMDDFWFDENIPWLSYRSDIHQVVVSPGVTSIGANAFSNCKQLVSVSLPEGLLTIGGSAFNHCETLPSINIPESVTSLSWFSFCGCYALNSFYIPLNVTEIGAGALSYCFQLSTISVAPENPAFVVEDGILYTKDKTELVCYPITKTDSTFIVPSSVTTIRDNAFGACEDLSSIVLPQGLEVIRPGAFDWCVSLVEINIPDSVLSIGQDAFSSCTGLTDVYYAGTQLDWNEIAPAPGIASATVHFVSIAESGNFGISNNLNWTLDSNGKLVIRGAGEMGWNFPWDPSQIKSVVLKPGVTNVGDYAFYNCTNLTSVTIPDTVTSIGNLAFSGCLNLTSFPVPAQITTIGSGAFGGCGLTAFIVDPDNTQYASQDGILFSRDMTTLICYPSRKPGTEYTVPNTVTDIENSAFRGCTNLARVTLPESLTILQNGLFYGCSNLTEVNIPSGVTLIGHSAFYNCTSLTEVLLPASVTEMDGNPFAGCTSLTDFLVENNNEHLDSVAGVLYSTWGETRALVCYPAGKSDSAYIIQDGTTYIGESAFSGCSNLHSLTIPTSVNTITINVFTNYFSGLTDITYIGSAEEWDLIRISENNDRLSEVIFHYSSGSLKASGTCGDHLTWTLDDDGTLTVSGTGEMYGGWNDEENPWAEYKEEILHAVVEQGVTSLGLAAFRSCEHLTDISLPDSLTYIGYQALGGCYSLAEVTIPDSVTFIGRWAFSGCPITSITIPAAVTEIEFGAFSYCTLLEEIALAPGNQFYFVDEEGVLLSADHKKLLWYPIPRTQTSYTVPDTVITLDGNAFSMCNNLHEIILPAGLSTIGASAFDQCQNLSDVYYQGTQDSWLSIDCQDGNDSLTSAHLHFATVSGTCGENLTWALDGDGVLTISGTGPMADYETDTAVPWSGRRREIVGAVINPGVTSIGTQAFHYCANLTGVSLPEGLTTIGGYAFNMCERLAYIVIPESVTIIEPFAFCGCYSLTGIHIPANVASIGYGALSYCHSLAELTVDPANTAFVIRDSVLFTADQTELVCYPPMKTGTSYSVPSTVTFVRDLAFTYCINLENITLPDQVGLGNEVFSECTSLTSVGLPSSLKTIPYKSFAYCRSLTDLIIPTSVTNIGGCAFQFCEALTNLTLPSSIINIEYCAFQHCINLKGLLEIPSSVKSIGNAAFQDCSSLTGLSLPSSITSIGKWSFQNCTGLGSTLVLPDSLTTIEDGAFSGCSGLTGNLDIPASVTSINLCAFQNCSGFTSLSLPSSITSIGSYSFQNCTGLGSSLILPEGLTTIGEGAFIGCSGLIGNLIIPSSVTSIGQWAFSECTGFYGYLQLPNSIDNVQEATFYNCNGIKVIYYSGSSNDWISFVHNPGPYNDHSVQYNSYVVASNHFEINQNLLWILDNRGIITIFGNGNMDSFSDLYFSGGEYPWGRENITGVIIMEGVTSIGDYAFCNHSQLGFITIPSSVTEIGIDALAFCPALSDIYVSDNNPYFSTNVGVLFNKNQTDIILYPCNRYNSTYTLPSSVTTICENAFYRCNQLTDITIPEGVTTIYALAFAYSHNLTDITIPSSVTQLSSDAFIGCSGLENIHVAAGNLNYSSINGVLFNAAGTSLVAYPCGRAGAYTVPDNVIEIQEYAFFRCDQLTAIAFPESLSVIHDHAFQFSNGLEQIIFPEGTVSIGRFSFQTCTNLASITLPRTLTSIGRRAFYGCPITDVYYAGLSLDSIVIDAGNEPLTDAVIHCHSINFILPEQLTAIESEAFAGVPVGSFIFVPDTVTAIAPDAFDTGTVIVTPSGSYAADWAAENGFFCYEQ